MKKKILYTLITTFCISAVLGIIIIVLDMWNDLTSRVLLTTITIFGYSIPTLCCSNLYEKKTHNALAGTGIALCVISALYILGLVWDVLGDDFFDVLKGVVTAIVIPTSLGHLSLMMLVNNKDESVVAARNATIVVSIILDCMIMLSLWIEDSFFSWQLYAIIGILVALGTIVTPILHKIKKVEQEAQQPVQQPVQPQGPDPVPVASQEESTPQVISKDDDLQLLKYLKDKGYLLDEEFNTISERITKKDS